MKKRYNLFLIVIIFLLSISACDRKVVTFIDYDGSIIQEVTVKNKINIPKDPQRVGYTFIGWDCDLDHIDHSFTTMAQYQVNAYQIKFSSLDEEITILYGDTVETLPLVTKEDHKFIGWTYQDELIKLPFVYNYPFDLLLEPSFKEGITYQVQFLDEFDKLIYTSIVERGSSALAPSAPLKEGYEFSAWDQSYNAVRNDIVLKPLYKPLEFYLYFDVTPKEKPILVKYDETVNLPHLRKDAHIFEGWCYGEELFSEQLTFKYLEDIHLSPLFREDDYNEMLNLDSLVSKWSEDAQSFQIDQIIKIKENKSDKNYLINLAQVSRVYPKYYYLETKEYSDNKLNNHNVIMMESSTFYLYKITPRINQTSLYTKELYEDSFIIDDYDNIIDDLSGRLLCEKIGHNNFLLITKLGDYNFFKELVKLNSQYKKYKDEIVYTIYYFDEINNLFYLKIETKLEFNLEYEILISEYNQIERIDFQAGDYEQTGTAKNPEVISDINKVTVKTQGLNNGKYHYYVADLEEGFYLIDLENYLDDNEATYNLRVSARFEDLSYPYSQVLSEINIKHKKLFYVKGGSYDIRLSGTHMYGYSFHFEKLDYLSFATFNNQLPLTETISRELEGIFDLQVYEFIKPDSAKSMLVSNINSPIMIVSIRANGTYHYQEYRLGINELSFEVTEGKNIIIIIGVEPTSYNFNIKFIDN